MLRLFRRSQAAYRRARSQRRALSTRTYRERNPPHPPRRDKATLLLKKRRRGSRGGRGRKRPAGASAGAGSTATQAKPKAETEAKPKTQSRREAQSGRRAATRRAQAARPTRRRQPQRRPPLPPAKRELLVSVGVSEQRVAVTEDDRSPRSTSSARAPLDRGNIYKGIVDNVLPGMEAAFVEIGLEKNGFLYVDEIVGPSSRANAMAAGSRT